ncbi:MAG: DUF1015 family protein [Actinobacteria bacterium]|nr:DUF1015 family protein [Actinomycetota bacterium]
MTQIQPFRAIRYNTENNRDISAVVAPPYDVIGARLRDELSARDEHNIVRIDLPHIPPASLGPPQAYARSAELLKQWTQQKVLVQDSEPALYYYQQTFKVGQITHTRCAFFARVKLEELGSGSIMPHEQTFSGPKEDRLALTKATRCNLSPVFCLYPDQNNEVLAALGPQGNEPDCAAELDGVRNELWAVQDAAKLARVGELMADKKVYIADGHHRYGTSLNYRKYLEESGQSIDDEHPANFINMVLVSAADAGLVILPTHRVLKGLPDDSVNRLRSSTAEQLDWIKTNLGADKAADFDAAIAGKHSQAMGLYDGRQDKLFVLVPTSEDLLATYAPDRAEAWRKLPVGILHRYLLEEKLGKEISPGCQPQISYVHADEAVRLCKSAEGGHQCAFLLQPTTMAQLLAVVEAGELMPQKSTFFYPKIPTGLVINPLY